MQHIVYGILLLVMSRSAAGKSWGRHRDRQNIEDEHESSQPPDQMRQIVLVQNNRQVAKASGHEQRLVSTSCSKSMLI